MKDNFDLKRFLLENNLTAGSRQLKEEVDEDIWKRIEAGIAEDDMEQLKVIALELLGKANTWAKDKVAQGAEWMKHKLDPTYGTSEDDEEINEAFNPKSKLAQIIAQAWAEQDLDKAKQIIRDLIEPSRIKAKEDLLTKMEPISNKKEFDYYLANSLLKFEGLGLNEGENITEWSPYGSIAFSGEKQKENEKVPLSSLEVGDLVYVKGVSHDYVVVKDKKEDGTVGVGHLHNDRISYQDGNKEAEVIKRASLKETKNENKMTSKEKQLVEMVNAAMGVAPTNEEDTYEAAPGSMNMYPDNMEEAEDIVKENPLPEYNTIEELMKDIEEGTGKTAMEYRMKRTKELYEALDEQLKSLEEGEHSKHIDKSHTRKMRGDSAKLRRYEAKLLKEYERKYNKKTTKKAAAPKKEEVPMEEIAVNESKSFDLRKFLVENKLTVNSRTSN